MLTESDPYGRPFKKILLISGRAGLGKTTLAHVIGKHAGYNIVEINASDDRTGEVLKNKLQGALTNRNINNGKPNLIVIDEIDGASQTGGDQSFMKFLTDLVNNDGKTGSAAFDAAGIKKKMKRATRITRPIICICNDLYAPVLKTLRAIAEIVIIPSPAPLQALSKRLEEICKLEGLRTDIHSLMQLCLITDGDLRSCLNTLQFAYSKISTIEKKEKKKKRFDVDFIEKLDIGLKDMEKNFFFILEELFTLPINSKKNASVEHGKFIQRLFKLIISNDDIERLIQGIFENYLSSLNSNAMSNLFQISKSHSDSASSRIDAALDWLSFYDILDSKVNQNPSCFGLKVYLPYSLISFHHFFASSFKRNNLVYPKADYQNYLKRKNLENILNEFNSSMELKSKLLWGFNNSRELYNKAGSSPIKIFLEFIPYLLKIISPELKGYNLVLMNAKDKSAVKKLVDIM
ncbi:Chromosome transmission fidelity protein 18 [Lobulomyces angularis]|nr:Chromosome transmission fidelity protein 18 [Lobulomyces angularis]